MIPPSTSPETPQADKPLLLTFAGVAKELSVSIGTVIHLADARELTRIRIGGCVRFHYEDVKRFADEKLAEARQEQLKLITRPWRK